jgi:hypothetical protein
LRSTLTLLLAVAAALTLGLWSAWLAVRSPTPVDTIALGAWQAWPNAGTAEADPYSRARQARVGEIPLGSGEGLMLLAQSDDAGAPLRAACEYRIAGQTPPARLWTVVLESLNGEPVRGSNGTAALGSDTLLRSPDGSFEIALSPKPQTGNWIATDGAAERFRIVIRLYDTSARTGTALTTLFMPRILRDRCA